MKGKKNGGRRSQSKFFFGRCQFIIDVVSRNYIRSEKHVRWSRPRLRWLIILCGFFSFLGFSFFLLKSFFCILMKSSHLLARGLQVHLNVLLMRYFFLFRYLLSYNLFFLVYIFLPWCWWYSCFCSFFPSVSSRLTQLKITKFCIYYF